MYGSSIGLEMAKQLAAPPIAEARKNKGTKAVAIVDISGGLVYFEKMDDTQNGSVEVSISKARSRRCSSVQPRCFRMGSPVAARASAF